MVNQTGNEWNVDGICTFLKKKVSVHKIEYPNIAYNSDDDSCNNSMDCKNYQCNLNPDSTDFRPRKGINFFKEFA